MGLLSPEVKKRLANEPDWQVGGVGARPGQVYHEVVIHDIGWHLIHPKSCKADRSGPRSELTTATRSFRASGEKKLEPCRFDEAAKGWTKKVAANGIYEWRDAREALILKVR